MRLTLLGELVIKFWEWQRPLKHFYCLALLKDIRYELKDIQSHNSSIPEYDVKKSKA
jgi:hypothetical protein